MRIPHHQNYIQLVEVQLSTRKPLNLLSFNLNHDMTLMQLGHTLLDLGAKATPVTHLTFFPLALSLPKMFKLELAGIAVTGNSYSVTYS